MALNPTDARAMLEASVRAQRHLWVGFSRRFLQAYLDLRGRLVRVRRDFIHGARCIFHSDIQNWRAVSTYLGDDTRGGGVLDDIVFHQVDLLPWLLGLEIQEISSEDLSAPNDGQHVRCQLKFENGLIAQCEAGHVDRYTETIAIELGDRTLVAHWRQGVREVWRRPGRLSLARFALLARSARQAVHRTSNPMAHSFERQWTSFAAVMQGRRPRFVGANASNGLSNVQALCAFRQSLRTAGRWTPLAREAAPLA